jgi:hypothetical protein
MKAVLLFAAITLAAVPRASAEVRLTMQNGRVSLVAKDATVRQILAEWARVGQTTIVNIDRVPGGPVTLELTDLPEARALDVLLRALSGYITAPRAVDAPNLSQFDRIIVMPTLAAARPATASTPPPPVFQQTPAYTPPAPAAVDDDQDDRANANAVAQPAPRGPVFSTFPQPQVVNPNGAAGVYPNGQPFGGTAQGFGGAAQPVVGGVPQQPAQQAPSAVPTAPYGGVAVPGMIVPAPQQPGQQQPIQVQPLQPQPRRPGGQ